MKTDQSRDRSAAGSISDRAVKPVASFDAIGAALPAVAMTWLRDNPHRVKVLDFDGRIVFANKVARSVIPLPPELSINGRYWWDHWPMEVQPLLVHAVTEARQGETIRFEGLCPTLGRSPRWWDVTVQPLEDGGLSLSMLLVVAEDITARKGAEGLVSRF